MKRVALALAVLACGGNAPTAAHVEIAPPPSASATPGAIAVAPVAHIPTITKANALVARTCGPTDGPATTLVVSDKVLTCDDWSRIEGAHVSIEAWSSLDLHDGAAIDLPGEMGGQVTTCTSTSDCKPARAALKVEHVTPDGFTGTLTVQTPWSRRDVAVRALRCSLHMLCG